MSKTSKRVLSMVLAVLMVVSMLSSFAVPALAADAQASGPDVANAYYVNPAWKTDGADVSFTWGGQTVTAKVGVKAFGTLNAALAAAKDAGNTCPDIIVPAWDGSNMVVEGGCKIYAPNWNTVPFIRDAQEGEWKAVNSNGADWTYNSAYESNKTIINNLIISNSASGFVGAYGFTIKDCIYAGGLAGYGDGKRTASAEPLDITVENTVVDLGRAATDGGDMIRGAYGNDSATQQDTLTIKNIYIKRPRAGANARIIPDAGMPSHIVIDGMWCDAKAVNLGRNNWIKNYSNVDGPTSITIKNSNLRYFGNGAGYIETAGYAGTNNDNGTENKVVWDNNVIYNMKSANSGTFYYRPCTYTSLTYKDNYIENNFEFNGMSLITGDNTASSVTNITVTGNKLLGFNSPNTVNGNFYAIGFNGTYNVSDNFLARDNGKTNAEYQATHGDVVTVNGEKAGDYYLDYNMTVSSADVEIREFRLGADDEVTIDGNEIMVNAKQNASAVTPTIKVDGKDTKVKISTKADFSDSVTAFDVSVKESVATYYIRTYVDGVTNGYIDYVLTLAVEKSKEVIDFESDNAYIINKDWTDAQLAGEEDLTVWFNGEDRTVNPKTDKLFNSYDKAHDAAFANLTAENYFTLNPIFVFGPGDYSGSIVHIPANATVYGANAGISPNAKPADEATINSIKADGGIAKNPDWNTEKTTKLGAIMFTTRTDDGSGTKWNIVDKNTAEGVKWQGLRDSAYAIDRQAEMVVTIDGITTGGRMSMSAFDKGSYTYNGQSMTTQTDRQSTIILKNSYVAANGVIGAWNTTWHYNNFVLDTVRIETNIDDFGERFVDVFTIKNSYLTNQTSGGALTKVWTGETTNRRAVATLNLEGNVFYNNKNAYFTINMDDLHDEMLTLNFNLKDSVLYNAGTANWGTFALYNREDFNRTLNVTVTGNEIYHDTTSNTFFNGNVDYITKGETVIKFNDNSVVGTLSALPPNSPYASDLAKSVIDYDFNDNYFSATVGGAPKVVKFGSGGEPKTTDGYTANNTWNFNTPRYYLDFDREYSSADAEITAISAGNDNKVVIGYDSASVNVFNKTGTLTAASFTTSGENNVVKIYDGSTEVTSIDLTKLTAQKVYTVKVGFEGAPANAVRTYNLVVVDGATRFNDALKTGIRFGDKTFTTADTVAFAPKGQSFVTLPDGSKAFYQYFNGVLYEYVVDNVNVFEYASKSISFNTLAQRNAGTTSAEGTQQGDGTWNWSRTGLDLTKVKAKAENGNIILAGSNFSADQFIIPYATSIYGLDAGVNPVDKSVATAENDFKAQINSEFGKNGYTKISTVRVGNVDKGTISIDGVYFTDKVYDTVRHKIYTDKADALNLVVKNFVFDTTTSGNAVFVLANPLSRAGITNNKGDTEGTGNLPADDATTAFGAVYNDSLVVENAYIKSASTNQIFDEQNPANITIKNLYVDNAEAARKREILAFFKTAPVSKTFNVTVEDSIFRNQSASTYDGIIHVEGPRDVSTKGDLDMNVTVNNNVFFKTGNPAAKLVAVKSMLANSITVTNNTFVALNETHNVYNITNGSAANVPETKFENNRYVGFTDAKIDLTKLDADAVEVNGYATTDATAYKNANGYTGYKATAFGTNDYYVNYAMTARASEFVVTGFEAGTSDVTDVKFDDAKKEIQFSLARGTTEGIRVELADGDSEWYFSTDAAGKNKIDIISRENLKQLVSTYYFNVKSNGVVLTYTVEVLNDIVPDFADAEGLDPAYFTNNAVILTDKAAGLAAGAEIFEQWDGKWYRFYAGVNAFDTFAGALASGADVPEVLVLEGTQENGFLNGDLDLRITRSMKVYTPNYNVNPVISDGYGTKSPSQGAAWGYNTAFDAHKDDVRIKSISTADAATVVEVYGLTIDCAFNDNARSYGNTAKFKIVNTLFTTSKDNYYVFNTNNNDYVLADQRNEVYVKNAYFGSPETTHNFRLMGELIPAHITFDNIYLDFDAAGMTNTSYIKHTSSDTQIVFKNSYLKQYCLKGGLGHLQFEGLLIDGGDRKKGTDDVEKQTLPEGYNASLVFDNNIMDGYFGYASKNDSVAILRMNGASFNDVQLTNNYFNLPVSVTRHTGTNPADTEAYAATTVTPGAPQIWWSMTGSENGGNIKTLEGKYTVTGNVFNGLGNTNIDYSNGGITNALESFDVTFEDNFITPNRGGNPFTQEIIGVAGSTVAKDQSGVGYYRLTADGSKLSNVIQDMEWSQRVSFSGTTAIANIYDCDNIYTVTEVPGLEEDDPVTYKYAFDLTSLIKTNKYGNVVKVAFGDGEAVALDELVIERATKIAEDTAIGVTITVDSPDGRADDKAYTFVIFMNGGDAPAFKGTFTDDANIITDNAVIVTPAANGATGTVNAQWMGETYSFTVGTNAFATVEDALAYAEANADVYATAPIEILLTGTTETTDLKIDYSCKIYGTNYNTLPYVTDGYGTDSVSYGTNWAENTAYTANETVVGGIYVTSATPKDSVIEVHGVTIKGVVADNARTQGNTASVLLNNIRVDYDNAAKNWESVTGQKNGANYWLNLGSPSNVNDKGNSFTLKNAILADLLNGSTNTALVGEFIPQNFTLDGVYADDAAKIGMIRGSWWIKYNVDDSTFTIRNSNFQKVMKSTTSTEANTWLNITVNDDKMSTTDARTDVQTNILLENNIFNSFQSRAFGSGAGSLVDLTTDAVDTIVVKDNYIANPYNEDSSALALFSTSGRSSVDHTDIDVTVENNVLNGVTWLDFSNGTYAKTVNAYIKGNYKVSKYVENIRDAAPVGQDLGINHHTAVEKYFALDYDRTMMSNVVGDVSVVDGTNILVDEDTKVVTYAYNDLVTKSESGAVTVDLTRFTELTNKYNTVYAVLSDGTEKDLSTIFTYDAEALGESFTVRVKSYDGAVSRDTYTVNFVEGKHVMDEWEDYTDAGCGKNAQEIRYCIAEECTIDEGTCGHFETREVEGTALPHQMPTTGYYNNDATCLADGTQTVYCKDCGESEVIPAPGTKVNYHKYENYVANNDGTCMVDGTMTAVCEWCGEYPSTILNPEDTKVINADAHVYGEYVYNDDATCCADGTQTRYCINEDADGNVCNHADKTITAPDTMLDHVWSVYNYNNDETCQNNGTETAVCPGIAEENAEAPECGAEDTREVENTKLDHHVFEEEAYELTKDATCVEGGYETAPCKYAYDGCTETHTRQNATKYPINPNNHDYAKPVYQEDATCVTDGTQTRKCKREGCGYVLTETAPGTAGQGTHVWGEYVADNNATCVTDGTMKAQCIADPNCTAHDTIANPADPAGRKAHVWGEYVYNNDATCVKDGTMTAYCTVDGCDATDVEKDPDHLKDTVAHDYTDWTSNNDATCTADGTKTRECKADRCYHVETVTDAGSQKAHAWGEYKYNNDATYFEDGTKTAKCKDCTATNTITAEGTKLQPKELIDTSTKFVDVKKGAWYQNAVDYAVTYGLISGTDATHFSPSATITRGMFVTILARAAGVDTSATANKAAKTQFTDVAAGKYYAAAVAWASSKNIVAGITTTTFVPDAAINRQQLAVMLYRFAQAQGITLKADNTVTFADATSVASWAKDGVTACAAAGIINGYNENGKLYFKPAASATRAEATQMIYKFHSEYITGTAK